MQVGDKRGSGGGKQRSGSGTEEEMEGNCRMQSREWRRVGTTGSISVKQAFQKALRAEEEEKK